jgi:hypothetical protein
MALVCPEWLSNHGGTLKLAPDGQTWFVMFDGGPQYALQPVPVKGQFGCLIKQTINGKRVDSAGTYATPEEAIRGGLEDVCKSLGW